MHVKLTKYYPEAYGAWCDDVASKQIPEDNPDGVGWPYEHGDMYIDKVTNVTQVTQEHLDEFVGELNKGDKDE